MRPSTATAPARGCLLTRIGGLLALALGLLVFLGQPGRAAGQDAAAWTISQEGSLLAVQISAQQGTLGSAFAHDHVARATEWSADLRYDPDDPSTCALRMEIPVRQLAVDDPETRRQFGLEPMSESNRADVRESMLDEGQLAADAYPTITITAESCERVDDNTVRAQVTVTVRGTPVSLPVDLRVQRRDGELRVQGDFVVEHSDFGIEPYSAFFGAVQNAEPIHFHAVIAARR